MHFMNPGFFICAVRWTLDWLACEYKADYNPALLKKDGLKRIQLQRVSQQLGRRRRPLPDLQELIDSGRAMEAGALCITPTRPFTRARTIPGRRACTAFYKGGSFPALLYGGIRTVLNKGPCWALGFRTREEAFRCARPHVQ